METIIKGVTIADVGSAHHGKQRDVLIKNGIIAGLEEHIETPANAQIWDEPGSRLSTGWVDLQADFADPGNEQKEGLENGCRAAQAGGFTHVVLNVGQHPVPDNKGAIAYLQSRSAEFASHIWPLASLSQGQKGEQLSEMYDLAAGGAVGFTDDGPVNRTELLRRALEYTTGMSTPVITCPLNLGLNAHPMMHEGEQSTLMGVVGNPSISETMRIKRDLDILRYTGGKLHFSCISAAESVSLIRLAKAEGLPVTCATSAHHMFFIDEDLADFDGTLKVMPPFRSETDRKALCEGVLDGTIDAIISDHRPEDLEHHDVEFTLAPFGLTSIESVYPVALSALGTTEKAQAALIRALTSGPRSVLGMAVPSIEVNQPADLTWYHPEKAWKSTHVSHGVNRASYSGRQQGFQGTGTPLGTLR